MLVKDIPIEDVERDERELFLGAKKALTPAEKEITDDKSLTVVEKVTRLAVLRGHKTNHTMHRNRLKKAMTCDYIRAVKANDWKTLEDTPTRRVWELNSEPGPYFMWDFAERRSMAATA